MPNDALSWTHSTSTPSAAAPVGRRPSQRPPTYQVHGIAAQTTMMLALNNARGSTHPQVAANTRAHDQGGQGCVGLEQGVAAVGYGEPEIGLPGAHHPGHVENLREVGRVVVADGSAAENVVQAEKNQGSGRNGEDRPDASAQLRRSVTAHRL